MTQPVEAALAAITVTSDVAFTWLGRSFSIADEATAARLSHEARRAALEAAITHRLYTDFYCCGWPRAVRRVHREEAGGEISAALGAAVPAMRWENGWQPLGETARGVVVTRGGITLCADRASVRGAGPGEDAASGVAVAMPTARPAFSPGHHLVIGRAPFDTHGRVWRLYWNVTAAGAPWLAGELARRLDEAGIAFHFKVLTRPDPAWRCDGAVLYLPHAALGGAARAIRTVAELAKRHLASGTPAMTRRIGPGLAYAESPRGGQSFGEHRCGLLADAVLAAADGEVKKPRERLALAELAFVGAGICLDVPHRLAGSPDPLAAWTMPLARRSAVTVGGGAAAARETSAEPPLATAGRVAEHLMTSAIHDGERCTWLTTSPGSGDFGVGDEGSAFGTLGPNLYAGQAGVGLFLATYAAATGDRRAAATALAALRQAVAVAMRHPAPGDGGLYTGLTGIALALATAGRHLATDALDADARRLLELADAAPPAGFDVLSGTAGRALGRLAAAALLGARDLLAQAVADADTLLATARRREDGGKAIWSWSAPGAGCCGGDGAVGDLLGYSHGAAGAAHALFAVYEATGVSRFLHAARAAHAYERQRFDARHGLWPDLRSPEAASAPERGEPVLCGWCNGAAGIGLARLFAARLDAPDANAADRAAAAHAVRHEVDRQAAAGFPDLSLCHGLAGALETLADLDDHPADGELAGSAFAAALHRHGPPARWPTADGPGAPGLMTGLAGIGYAALRRARPATPSLLAIDPAAFAALRRRCARPPARHPFIARQGEAMGLSMV
ncbi:lanthionine synthetase LanC family protein [Acuticoccus sp. I52.16.1]|uniref:lanthionine synthetase LanC family protein n=1 Tax=Acuticoccus sp. I52.16.1 TaxID=2928472 RepID=UPI001FD41FAB|nr:lanthionine synthetase LanC family protein [Acuticoccus sp. I52.16.1]UOM34891.1 T3SS effector HopA1 family protein [Acuticoccus sp. I52.16.1]